MREKIDTVPVNEAFETEDECPFCYLERQVEQKAIRYILGPGASYMEPDVRAETDRQGFCREHIKKLYDYGNSLGNALILQTYYVGMLKDLDRQIEGFAMPQKKGLFAKKPQEELPLAAWAKSKEQSCFLCSKMQYNMQRYYATFFHLIKEPEFREKVEKGKGFCMHHFAQLLEAAEEKLSDSQRQWFYDTVLTKTRQDLARVQADLDWFIEKFDYRNVSAPWKNSKDAVPRAMQKLRGIYPSDPPYKEK